MNDGPLKIAIAISIRYVPSHGNAGDDLDVDKGSRLMVTVVTFT